MGSGTECSRLNALTNQISSKSVQLYIEVEIVFNGDCSFKNRIYSVLLCCFSINNTFSSFSCLNHSGYTAQNVFSIYWC